jgi:hypothetical protein
MFANSLCAVRSHSNLADEATCVAQLEELLHAIGGFKPGPVNGLETIEHKVFLPRREIIGLSLFLFFTSTLKMATHVHAVKQLWKWSIRPCSFLFSHPLSAGDRMNSISTGARLIAAKSATISARRVSTGQSTTQRQARPDTRL